MKSSLIILTVLAAVGIGFSVGRVTPPTRLAAQAQAPTANPNVPTIPFDSVPNPLKYSADMNLGEVLAVAVDSRGHITVLNHPGSATSGPLYGNATTQLLTFDENGKFLREMGRGVYGLG